MIKRKEIWLVYVGNRIRQTGDSGTTRIILAEHEDICILYYSYGV